MVSTLFHYISFFACHHHTLLLLHWMSSTNVWVMQICVQSNKL
ncbi:hypothetical protein LINPERPRIM_LOCUS13032 [Linum perenne]